MLFNESYVNEIDIESGGVVVLGKLPTQSNTGI